MKNILRWVFPNQFSQEGSVASSPLRAQLCLRNYYLCAQNLSQDPFESILKTRLLHHLQNKLFFEKTPLLSFEELEQKKRIKIFAYGSLLHPVSASFNIKSVGRPVMSFGLKRIFNYYQEDMDRNPLGLPNPNHPLESARLNIKETREVSDILPGVLYEIDQEELRSLKKREKGYLWKKIQVVDYQDAFFGELPEELEEAYVLILPEKQERNSQLPHQNYLNVCLEGAKKFGKHFLKFFANTTYLSDGETTILEWLRDEVITMNLELIPAIN